MEARSKQALIVLAGVLALLAAFVWPIAREPRSRVEPRAEQASPARASELVIERAASTSAHVHAATADRHPHPITEEHRRLYREVDLIEGAAASLRKSDITRARELLAKHRTEYGTGSDNEGLTLLADCLEESSPAAIERAQAFYDSHTHSMVRRQIRKQCLEVTERAR